MSHLIGVLHVQNTKIVVCTFKTFNCSVTYAVLCILDCFDTYITVASQTALCSNYNPHQDEEVANRRANGIHAFPESESVPGPGGGAAVPSS